MTKFQKGDIVYDQINRGYRVIIAEPDCAGQIVLAVHGAYIVRFENQLHYWKPE